MKQFLTFFILLLINECIGSSLSIEERKLWRANSDNVKLITVNTPIGQIEGFLNQTLPHQYYAFLGIPFAQPPVNQLRWTDPVPAGKFQTPYRALEFQAGCPQDCILPPHTCPIDMSEDCLYLNVYVPANFQEKKQLSVMFFIPGGRFEQGAAGTYLYDGGFVSNISETIIVTTDYRLGALGFFRSASISGNFGIKDQRVALKWVQTNIASFNGNPKNVTLFGQSAGASSTAVHLTSPLSKGLFSNAIIESDPFTLPMLETSKAIQIGDRFTKDLKCNIGNITCLREKTYVDVLAAQKLAQKHVPLDHPLDLFMPWTPTTDGTPQLPIQPMEALQSGKWNQVPLMLGTVQNEALLFVYQAAGGRVIDELEYILILGLVFGDDIRIVEDMYPGGSPLEKHDERSLMSRLGTDYIFTCPYRHIVRGISNTSAYPVFLYEWDHPISFDAWGFRYPYCYNNQKDIVCHGSELPFVFHAAFPFFNFTSQEEILSIQTITYWTNFAKSGNPNIPKNLVPENVVWPEYKTDTDVHMSFVTPKVKTESGLRKKYCDFWDTIGYHKGA